MTGAHRQPNHVAVVGCGFSGTSALYQLVERWPVSEITVFEARGRFGPGYPYRPDECPDYLINNTTDTMCLTPENRRAFIDWLATRPDVADASVPDEIDPKGHLPRAVYGKFLQDVIRTAMTMAAIKGIRVRLVPDNVTDIEEADDGTVTLTSDGGRVTADAALLALGRCPPAPPALDQVPPGTRLIADHVSTDALDDLPLDARVHILGASLSAYDVVNRLFSPTTGCRFQRDGAGQLVFEGGPNRRQVLLASRSGRLKKLQSRERMPLARRHLTRDRLTARAAELGGLTLEDVASLIAREAEAHGIALDPDRIAAPYRGCTGTEHVTTRAADILAGDIAAARERRNFLVDLFADAQVDIWDAFGAGALKPAEQARYRREFETATLTHAAPAPIPTGEKLLALMRAGRLAVLTGTGTPIVDRQQILVPHGFGTDRATVVVDTTHRVDRDVTSQHQPALVRNLVARGLMKPDACGLGAAVGLPTLRLEGSRRLHLTGMLLWGPGIFTSSAYLMALMTRRALTAMFDPDLHPAS